MDQQQHGHTSSSTMARFFTRGRTNLLREEAVNPPEDDKLDVPPFPTRSADVKKSSKVSKERSLSAALFNAVAPPETVERRPIYEPISSEKWFSITERRLKALSTRTIRDDTGYCSDDQSAGSYELPLTRSGWAADVSHTKTKLNRHPMTRWSKSDVYYDLNIKKGEPMSGPISPISMDEGWFEEMYQAHLSGASPRFDDVPVEDFVLCAIEDALDTFDQRRSETFQTPQMKRKDTVDTAIEMLKDEVDQQRKREQSKLKSPPRPAEPENVARWSHSPGDGKPPADDRGDEMSSSEEFFSSSGEEFFVAEDGSPMQCTPEASPNAVKATGGRSNALKKPSPKNVARYLSSSEWRAREHLVKEWSNFLKKKRNNELSIKKQEQLRREAVHAADERHLRTPEVVRKKRVQSYEEEYLVETPRTGNKQVDQKTRYKEPRRSLSQPPFPKSKRLSRAASTSMIIPTGMVLDDPWKADQERRKSMMQQQRRAMSMRDLTTTKYNSSTRGRR